MDDDGPSSCVIEDDIVVFNTESCTLFACRADTGQMLWSWWLGDPLTSAPVVAGPEVYITTFSGTLYTFNTKDGTIGSAIKARATSAPTITGDKVYYTKRTDKDQGSVKESMAAGKRKQLQRVATSHEKRANYLDEKIQKESQLDKRSKNLDAGNGFSAAPQASGYQKAYKNVGQGSVSSMQSFQGSRILHYQKKNYTTIGDELICTDIKSGKAIWKSKFKGDMKRSGGFLATPPLAVDGHIIVATLDGGIEQYKADTGQLEKRYALKAPIRFQPIVMNGRIFTGTQDGRVICIDTRNPKLTGWPSWGRDAAHTGLVQ